MKAVLMPLDSSIRSLFGAGVTKSKSSKSTSKLVPDAGMMRRHLDLFKFASDGGWLSFRGFRNGGGSPPSFIHSVQLDGSRDTVIATALAKATIAANSPAPGLVFTAPIATFTNSRAAKTSDLKEGLVIVAEIDQNPDTAVMQIVAVLGEPTLDLYSGGITEHGELKRHLYWQLSAPASTLDEHDILHQCLVLVARLVGSDQSATAIVHPLRFAGSLHTKNHNNPRLCEVRAFSDHTIDLASAHALLTQAIDAAGLQQFHTAKNSQSNKQSNVDGYDPTGHYIEAMSHVPLADPDAKVTGRAWWIKFGFHLARAGRCDDAAFMAWDNWSQQSDYYNIDVLKQEWKTIIRAVQAAPNSHQGGAGSIFHYASRNGWHGYNPHVFDPATDSTPDDGTTQGACHKEHYGNSTSTAPEQHNQSDTPAAPKYQRRPPPPKSWPARLDDAAYHGIAGEFTVTASQHSEGDPVAFLLQFLTYAGMLLGKDCYYTYSDNKLPPRFSILLVGATGDGRGGSLSTVRRFFRQVKPDLETNLMRDLRTEQGLIARVHDDIYRTDDNGTRILVSPAVEDKRLLAEIEEFAALCLAMTQPHGGGLRSALRHLHEGNDLFINTKEPQSATGIHFNIIAHVTPDELHHVLKGGVDTSNGFLNRFLVACVRSWQYVPTAPHAINMDKLIDPMRSVLAHYPREQLIYWNTDAEAAFHAAYPSLNNPNRQTTWKNMAGRAAPHVARLSLIYAMLDKSPDMKIEHLAAAQAVWAYVCRSVEYCFPEGMGNYHADAIYDALQDVKPNGLSKTAIQKIFNNHARPSDLKAALKILADGNYVYKKDVATGGRPCQTWFMK